MNIKTDFLNGKIAIDIRGITEKEIQNLTEWFIENDLECPYHYIDSYLKESIDEDWVFIFYDETGLNAYKETLREYVCENFKVFSATDFLIGANPSPSFEIEDEEFSSLF